MAGCSWEIGEYERPMTVPYPYDFLHQQKNQSCIIEPNPQSYLPPKYLARAMRDEQNGMLIADIDPSRVTESKTLQHNKRDPRIPWEDILKKFQDDGYIEWMK